MDRLLRPEEIAERLGVKLSTIYNWTHIGFIPHIKMGRLIRFKEDDVSKWVASRAVKGRKTWKIDIKDLGLP